METLVATVGVDSRHDLQFRDQYGRPAVYASGNTLAAQFWAGDDTANLFTPTMAWISEAAGTARVSWTAANTSSLAASNYQLLVKVTVSGTTYVAHRAWVKLLPAPGAAAAAATYGSYDEMLRYAPWLDDLAARSDQAGFAEQRAEARRWFDRLIQRHYRSPSDVYEDSLDHWLDGGTRRRRSGADDPTLQGYLDADGLILTGPSGTAVKRACALYAAAMVAQAQITDRADDVYATRYRRLIAEAEAAAMCLTVLVDTDDDGDGDWAIDLGTADVIRG